jgi:hypothetical protein
LDMVCIDAQIHRCFCEDVVAPWIHVSRCGCLKGRKEEVVAELSRNTKPDFCRDSVFFW